MSLCKLFKINQIFFIFLIVFFLVNNSALANKHPTEACWDNIDCDGACPSTNPCEDVGETNCEAGFSFACSFTKFTGGEVNIGRDFKIGNISIYTKPGFENISSIISSILPNIYIIAGIIMLFLIIGGGFAIMSAENDPQKKAQGSKAITAALIGFLIIFASYWIVQIIQEITGVPILDTSNINYLF